MKILYCHNYYQQRGGEDLSFESDVAMLREAGHEVLTYTRHNDELIGKNRLRTAIETIWNQRSAREVAGILAESRPDILHCNNLFPRISPSIYAAAHRLDIPVVQALRNYRMFCANSFFYRDAAVCTACLTRRLPLAGIRHACYRDSRLASAVVTAMQVIHRSLGTWRERIDMFFTPSEFSRELYVRGGLAAERIGVKPNFIDPDPGLGSGDKGYAIFVGRLSAEKGIEPMMQAWESGRIQMPLCVIGDGPLRSRVTDSPSHPIWLGQLPAAEVLSRIGQARCLVMPSQWYETFGRTIVEGFSCGTPVISTNIGAMAELVEDNVSGFQIAADDKEALIAAVNRIGSDDALWQRLRAGARQRYLARYTKSASLKALLDIYQKARFIRQQQRGLISPATGSSD